MEAETIERLASMRERAASMRSNETKSETIERLANVRESS